MPRIVGVDIPNNKRIEYSLCYVYGVSLATSRRILKEAGVSPEKRAKDLTEEEVGKISSVISRGYKVEGDLRREITQNIKRLIGVGAYRGYRHRRGLPVRGQRTKTNSRTRKGPRKTVGVKRKTTMQKPGG